MAKDKQHPNSDPMHYLLQQTYQLSRREIQAGFKENNIELSPEQWSLISELAKEDEQSPSELAKKTGRDKPSASRLIESLKKQELVERVYGQKDRRAHLIKLTEKGRQLHQQLVPVHASVIEQSLQDFSTKEKELLNEMLKKMYTNLRGDRITPDESE